MTRPKIRFINRQPGSGTRYLLDLLLQKEGIATARIMGYEQCELTHAAVAAYVASDMADAGYGVETPVHQFKLEFVPSQTERYFLLCNDASLESDTVRQMLAVLRSESFASAVDELRGYRLNEPGSVLELGEAFEALRAKPWRTRRR